MDYSSYSVKVPGKLMIAGEYAVLEPKQKAVVIAVNRYVTAYIKPHSKNHLSLPQMGLEDITWELTSEGLKFNIEDSRLNFLQNSMAAATAFLHENSIALRPFHLSIVSELDDSVTGKKYGLGSSAAISAAVISAVLQLHRNGGSSSLEEIFKLSAIAHLKTQGSGSGADIAAAVYGGWLEYSAFSSSWILKSLEDNKKLTEIIKSPWPNLSIRKLTPPSDLCLAVGWTKEAAATAPMIKCIQSFRKNNLNAYEEFLNESSLSVKELIDSFEENNSAKAVNALVRNRKALCNLGAESGADIETEKLKKLSSIADNFGCGKSSGAGGGDCGIAFLKKDTERQELYKEWIKANIIPLDLTVSMKGINVLKINEKNWDILDLSS